METEGRQGKRIDQPVRLTQQLVVDDDKERRGMWIVTSLCVSIVVDKIKWRENRAPLHFAIYRYSAVLYQRKVPVSHFVTTSNNVQWI